MGRATRWLRSLLGGKKDAKAQRDNASYNGCEAKDKKRWSFTQTRPPSAESPCHSPASALEVAWLRSFYDDGEEESKHAIAVAVATAAAANAAVTAAQAAMVRLKSLGRERTAIHGSYEWWAAVKIQTAFRCYLAKKALRALKGLVKLQALVRGFLVRKQAAITLRRLQALIRAQSAARPREPRVVLQQQGQRLNAEFCHRRSFERFHTREAARCKHMASEQSYGLDRSPKIVEMDTFQPKSKSFRSALEEPAAMPISSPLQYLKIPSRLSIPRCRNSEDYHCFRNPDMSAYSKTALNTPRLRPWAPARSTSADGAPRHTLSPSNCPNYMASTTSFVAKARAQSAPKQRAEKASPRKKLLGSEVAEYMTGVSGGGGGRSPLQAQEEAAYDLKCGKVGKIDRSPKAVRGAARDRCMDGMW